MDKMIRCQLCIQDTTDEAKPDSAQGGELLPVATGENRKQRAQPQYPTNSTNTGASGVTHPVKNNNLQTVSNGTAAKAAPQQRVTAKGKK
jgi:hypothetical protein